MSQPLRPLYPFSLKEELAKNPKLKEADLQILREWCSKQAHLPKIGDVYLRMFLHCNYYRLEPTKLTIENFFTMRTHIPEFFSQRDPIGSEGLRKAIRIASAAVLPKRTPNNCVIVYGALFDHDPSHFNFNDTTTWFYMLIDMVALKYTDAEGIYFVGDCTGVSFGHVGRVSPLGLKKSVYYVQDAAPIRLKGVHFINAPPVMEIFLSMAKPFMNKELIELVHFHSTPNTIAEYVPLDILPQGKEGEKMIHDLITEIGQEMDDNREWFLEEAAKFRVDESQRIGESKSAGDLFGVEGSFKKLDID